MRTHLSCSSICLEDHAAIMMENGMGLMRLGSASTHGPDATRPSTARVTHRVGARVILMKINLSDRNRRGGRVVVGIPNQRERGTGRQAGYIVIYPLPCPPSQGRPVRRPSVTQTQEHEHSGTVARTRSTKVQRGTCTSHTRTPDTRRTNTDVTRASSSSHC